MQLHNRQIYKEIAENKWNERLKNMDSSNLAGAGRNKQLERTYKEYYFELDGMIDQIND